jgi:acyl-CoA synthetase (AMP-forming)/AMP-acid ligase II
VSLAQLLDGLPDTAVFTLGADVSREDLAASAERLGTALVSEGLQTGQVVAAMLPNDATTIAALFGTWRAGGVYTPLNPRAADPELVSQLETLRPVAVITTPELAERFSPFELPVVTGSELSWALSRKGYQPSDPRQYDADVALLQFTSGTTGPPKPVPLRHATVLDLIDRLLEKLRGAKSTTPKSNRTPMPNLVPLSLSLWAGIYQVLFAFRAGSGVVLMDRFTAGDFAALVKRHQLRSTV